MTNQPIGRQNFDNQSAEIPPARRVYALKDLPPEVRQNLLRLQNTDGDFLRVRYVVSYTSGVILLFLSIGFLLYLAAFLEFADAFGFIGFDLKWTIIFAVSGSVFALCYWYLIRKLLRAKRSPIKKGIYLTPTQVIETFEGNVRFRDLKDAGEIIIDKFQGGWRTSLHVKFPDGDIYKFMLYMNLYSVAWSKQIPEQFAEAEKWRAKFDLWRNEAISAAQRGDAAYFDSHDIISKSATANLPHHGSFISPYFMIRLLSVITFAMFGFVLILFYVIKIISE